MAGTTMSPSEAVTGMLSAPPRSRDTSRSAALVAWLDLVVTTLARTSLLIALTLGVAALIPAFGAWGAYVVRTGSMAPAIKAGDIVLSAPLAHDAPLPIGRVVTFVDPAKTSPSAPDRVLVHRVLADRGDGTFTTGGDANRSDDSTPAPRSSFIGQGRLLVPWIGRPVMWAATRNYPPLAGLSLLLTTAAVLSCRRSAERAPKTARGAARTARRRVAVAGTTILVIASIFALSTASAAFTATSRNSGNSWAFTSRLLLGYDAQILADAPYAYYKLDDATGPTMVDASGNLNRNGTFASGIAYRQPGALSTVPGYSVGLNGGGARMISGGPAITAPTTFSFELWFQTTTTTGGKLAGFESTQQSTSPKYDRHIFMRNDGRLSYGGWPGNTRVLTTTTAYNDGKWHHLVVTARPNGNSANEQASLYVDGTAVLAGNVDGLSSYAGWWRSGYGALPQGTGYPASADFTGRVDNIAIYITELSATRVADHYASR